MEDIYLSWDDLKDQIKLCNPELAKLLERVFAERPHLKMHQFTYKYGDFIFKKGKLCLPQAHKDKKFTFALVINGGLESFIEDSEKTIPVAMMRPGQVLDLSVETNYYPVPLSMQTITAGARTTFLAPKITNSDRFWRLAKRHKLPLDVPHSLFAQWKVFAQIANNNNSPWRATILVFPIDWINGNTLAVAELKNYLFKQQKMLERNSYSQSMRSDLVLAHVMRELNFTNPYIASILKQLFAIISETLPGFIVTDNELFVPQLLIREAFLNDYGMDSLPTLILPGYAVPDAECFYSVELETLLKKQGKRSKDSSGLDILKAAQMVYNQFIQYVQLHQACTPEVLNFLKAQVAFIHGYTNTSTATTAKVIPHTALTFMRHNPFSRQGCISVSKPKASAEVKANEIS